MHIEPLERRRRGLRLAPLVDVVFLLLVFFMLVARLETPRAIDIEPPAKTGGGPFENALLVRLGADGSLDLNGLALELDRLPQEIAPFLARDPRPRILVQPASGAPLQSLVTLLDRLEQSDAGRPTLLEPR